MVCEKRTYSKEFQSHTHEYGQFLFPLEGSLDIQTEQQRLHLNADYCFYLPPHFKHVYRSNVRNEFLILDMPYTFVTNALESMYIPLDEQWKSIRYLLLEEASHREQNSSGIRDLTGYVSHQLRKSGSPSIEYIHHHYKEAITLDTLAAMEHYHPVYYSAWFKRKTGKSPSVYINQLRLDEAKQMLGTTSWSMTTISQELGFENSSSFTRWFVKNVGNTPKQYRIIQKG